MIVCLCNGLNDKEIQSISKEEYESIVRCGKCRECYELLTAKEIEHEALSSTGTQAAKG